MECAMIRLSIRFVSVASTHLFARGDSRKQRKEHIRMKYVVEVEKAQSIPDFMRRPPEKLEVSLLLDENKDSLEQNEHYY